MPYRLVSPLAALAPWMGLLLCACTNAAAETEHEARSKLPDESEGLADAMAGELGGSPAADRACDPLAMAAARELALGEVVAAGRAADGTLYVIDNPVGQPAGSHEARVFVSEGETLVRRRVLGSGSSTSELGWAATYTFEDEAAARPLAVGLSGATVRGLALAPPGRRNPEQALAEGEPLELVAAEAVRALPLRDLPGEVVVEYFAEVADGSRLVVTRPRDDWGYDDFRLFWGERTLLERPVASVVRRRDGGTTDVVFQADGEELTAYFPSPLSPRGEPTLTTPGETLALTRRQPSELPADLTFRCLP